MGLRMSKISYKMSKVEQQLGYVTDEVTGKEEASEISENQVMMMQDAASLPNVAVSSVTSPATTNLYHSNSSLSSGNGEISCVPWPRSSTAEKSMKRRKGKTFPVRDEASMGIGLMKKPKKNYLKGIGGSKKKETGRSTIVEETSSSMPTSSIPSANATCVCTAYRRTSSESQDQRESVPGRPGCSSATGIIENVPSEHRLSVPPQVLGVFNPEDYPIEDEDEKMRRQRAKEMVEGVELSEKFGMLSFSIGSYQPAHSQIDYIHVLVPDLKEITSCSFYWGKIDRYAAEKLLEEKPEGTFLLRDSAQEEYLFSVSFRRYGRSLHARIEQWGHAFSFDAHDPSVFSAPTVTGLIEHYKDPSYCMFFEPMLTQRLHRNFTFSLQHLARSVVCNSNTYDSISSLPLPRALKEYCREYHYKQRVRVRNLPD